MGINIWCWFAHKVKTVAHKMKFLAHKLKIEPCNPYDVVEYQRSLTWLKNTLLLAPSRFCLFIPSTVGFFILCANKLGNFHAYLQIIFNLCANERAKSLETS